MARIVIQWLHSCVMRKPPEVMGLIIRGGIAIAHHVGFLVRSV
jgi:hypothetical protein